MTLQQIKDAILAGKNVYWKNDGYKVIKGKYEYLIVYTPNGSAIGLTWQDGVTMNGEPEDFYIGE